MNLKKQRNDDITRDYMEETLSMDATPSMRRVDENGYMHVAMTPISKATVNGYIGHEIPGWRGLGLQPDKIYYGLRDPQELRDAAPTFNGLPLLYLHHNVDAETPAKEYTVGATGTDAVFDGTYLKNSVVVHDAKAIKMIEDGSAKEISCAYRFTPDFTPGVYEIAGNKINYNFIMRDIRGNHVALVPAGRAGHDVAVADAANPEIERKEKHMEDKVILDSMDAILDKFAPEMSAETRAAFKEAVEALPKPEPVEPVTDELPEDEVKAEEPAAEEKPAEEPQAEAAAPAAEEKPAEAAEEVKAEEPAAEAAEPAPAPEPEVPAEPTAAADAEIVIDAESPMYKAGYDAGKVVADGERAEIRTAAIEHCKSLMEAAAKVKPLIGTVDALAYDSAEAIYKFALDKAGKRTADYEPSAYRAMVDMLLDGKPEFKQTVTVKGDFSDAEMKSLSYLRNINH